VQLELLVIRVLQVKLGARVILDHQALQAIRGQWVCQVLRH
jgi:predicted RNA-binding protein YlxR (DUF448 family)